MAEFLRRPRFVSAYPATMTPSELVDQLFVNAEVAPVVTKNSIRTARL
jgi:hypothetical protein